MTHKYSYDADKMDKIWTIFRDRVNNKGRNLKSRVRDLLSRRHRRHSEGEGERDDERDE